MKILKAKLALMTVLAAMVFTAGAQNHYQSFTVSTYIIQGTVQSLMSGRLDPAETWSNLTRNLKVDKVYIEVMRNHTLVDEAGLEKLKKFFQAQGVQVCGGLAYSISEVNGYQGLPAKPWSWPPVILMKFCSMIITSSTARPIWISKPKAGVPGRNIDWTPCAR